MRSTLSDDLQDIGWWLASDGKWYAPDLHPAMRPISAEQARIAALLDATIGVAQVRDKLFAQVHDQGRTGTSPSGDRGAYPGTQYVSAEDRSSGQGTGARHGPDPLPRFGRTDRPNWPFEARSPSESVTPRPETRWRPDAQQMPDTRRPPSRTISGPDRPAPVPPTLGQPRSAVPAPAPPVPRWKPKDPPAPDRPADDRGPSFARVVREPEAAPPPAPTTSATLAPPEPIAEPPPAPSAPMAALDKSLLPPTARRRPSVARSPTELRQAVAGAVARAAAQGPLIPRGTEEAEVPPPLAPSALVAPAEPAAWSQAQPTIVPESPSRSPGDAGQTAPGTGEELAGRTGEQAAPGMAPRRRSTRPLTASAPAAGFAHSETAPPDLLPTQPVPTDLEEAPADSTFSGVAVPGALEPELHFPGLSNTEDPSWPLGERRSFARQARKPLPAALQAAVASEVAQADPGTPALQPVASKDIPEPAGALLGGAGANTEASRGPVTGKKPSILSRYASAIAIVAVFVAAGGAAAGIAAFRGPINRPALPTPARDQVAADGVVLRASDFPPSWHVSKTGITAGSYGVGSGLVTPAIVHAWLTTHQACVSDLDSVSAALTASDGDATAVATSQATTSDSLGASWEMANIVTFHSVASQASTDLTAMRSLINEPSARACLSQFWAASLLAGLPPRSHVTTVVSPAQISFLPEDPPLWAMSMTGTATVRQIAIPFYFEFASFVTGRVQVSFATSSKLASLSRGLDESLLVTLAIRAERYSS